MSLQGLPPLQHSQIQRVQVSNQLQGDSAPPQLTIACQYFQSNSNSPTTLGPPAGLNGVEDLGLTTLYGRTIQAARSSSTSTRRSFRSSTRRPNPSQTHKRCTPQPTTPTYHLLGRCFGKGCPRWTFPRRLSSGLTAKGWRWWALSLTRSAEPPRGTCAFPSTWR